MKQPEGKKTQEKKKVDWERKLREEEEEEEE